MPDEKQPPKTPVSPKRGDFVASEEDTSHRNVQKTTNTVNPPKTQPKSGGGKK